MSLDVSLFKNINDELSIWQSNKDMSLNDAKQAGLMGLLPMIEEYYNDRKPEQDEELFEANITHNLTAMAEAAGIYKALWRPEELGISTAKELIPLLTEGLSKLRSNQSEYIFHYSPKNGWGTCADLVKFTQDYLDACKEYPDATISISR